MLHPAASSTPGSARLAVARFAHPGLLPVARFGAEENGFRSDTYPRLRSVVVRGDTRPRLPIVAAKPVEAELKPSRNLVTARTWMRTVRSHAL